MTISSYSENGHPPVLDETQHFGQQSDDRRADKRPERIGDAAQHDKQKHDSRPRKIELVGSMNRA